MNREKFSSRLGFILISAGCAIGLGNVWRFPYIAGKYGGAAFVLIYLFFLVILGLPIMVMEFSVGRASQKSSAKSFDVLEPKNTKWHLNKYVSILGNYLLMMFYTTVGAWMLIYFFKMLGNDFSGLTQPQISDTFSNVLKNAPLQIIFMAIVVCTGFFICSKGLQNGVEKVSKYMMLCLLGLMGILMVRSLTLDGAMEGLKFYLVPDFNKMKEAGFMEVIFAAMGQAFFTLSLGIGSLAIFGSYIGKERRLFQESINVAILDTAVALIAGLIIFPACFSNGVNPGEGPGLVFITLPSIFNNMAMGNIFGALFFLFMSFAAMTTIIAVFETIISFFIDLFNWSRKKAVIINMIAILLLSIPCILGFNEWSHITIAGMDIQSIEDFIVSNNLLPLGSLIYLLFCTTKKGWGWKNFTNEANSGKGLKIPEWSRRYVTYILPFIILTVLVYGYITKFFI